MALQIQQQFPVFADVDGTPLNNGFIYIGTANLNPETNPIACYWDLALTLPAAQPFRTSGGYIVRNGNQTMVYTGAADYSITVRNKNSALVYSTLTSFNANSANSVTIVDAGGDATTWPLLATAQTGNLAPATDASLTYDALNNLLSVPSLAVSTAVSGSGFSTYLASPPAIGGTTPAAGTFTSLTATSASGFSAPSKFPSVGAVQAGGAITVSCAAIAMDFRSTTLTSGTPTTVVTSNVDLVIPSGATLGTTTTIATRIAVAEIYTGTGTVKAVANIAGGLQMDETNLISTTLMDTASDSANVWYSAAAQTNKPYRIVGFFDAVNTAGAWGSPSLVQSAGGESFVTMSGIGFGQTWQVVTRTAGTIYYNTTEKPIQITLFGTNSVANGYMQLTVNGLVINGGSAGTGVIVSLEGIILPPGAIYSWTGPTGVQTGVSVLELR